MSVGLPELTFYRLADVTPAASTLAAVLDAIHGADWTADYRGTAIPASHQWTKGRYQNAGTTEAVYLTPPSGTPMTRNPAVLFAGSAAATPTMQTDTFLASALLVGINRGAGSFNAWDAALPFTTGAWSGFNRVAGTGINSTATTIRIYVSAEVIVLDIWSSSTAHYPVIVGAIIEAHTDDPAACESDDRLYGCITQGSTAALSATLLTSTATLFEHVTAVGSPHAFVFVPGDSTVYTCSRDARLTTVPVGGSEVDESGQYVSRTMHFVRTVSPFRPLGRLREIGLLGIVQGARTRRNGSIDLFHVIGANSGADDDAFCIKAAA